MNINDPSQIRDCTSCQMCEAVCPTSAITIVLNQEGFYRPEIEEEKCINCGLCVKSCYKFDNEINITSNLKTKTLYAGWVKNSEVVRSTTSGGIADILAKELISKGFICIGIVYDAKTNCAKAKVASTQDETDGFRSSKYIQALTGAVFKTLVKSEKDVKFAVFGLPCHIYAIDRFLKARGTRNKHILIDLYCHGCPTLNLWSKYINETLTKFHAKNIISVNFRSKVRGWGKFCVETLISTDKGIKNVTTPLFNDPFYDLFFSDTILNDSCYKCELRSTLEYTDIRLGDFWGPCYVVNHKGVSGITICTKNAQKIFETLQNQIYYESQLFNNFIPFQSYGKKYSIIQDIRSKLLNQLADPTIPLTYSQRTYECSLPIKKRIINLAKKIIKILPISLESNIKKTFYLLHHK